MAKENKNTQKVVEQSILGVEKSTPEKVEADELAKVGTDELPKVEVEKVAKLEAEKMPKVQTDKKSDENTTYIMKVVSLAWGTNKQNHFYAYEKPTISRKVMGNNHSKIIDIWLKENWIQKGKY